MSKIDELIENTIGKEGAYSNHPSDRGGPTRWGIIEHTARKHGYSGDMKLLPRATAVVIYRTEYLIAPGFADVAAISMPIGEELFDTGVNTGPSVPAIWFQQWLNAFNQQGKLYGDIREDGNIGPATLAALRAYLKARGSEAVKVMLAGLNGSQAVYYMTLARNRPANEDFAYGWLRGRVA